MNLMELLRQTTEKGASDLHISAGLPPSIRIDGELKSLDLPVLNATEAEQLIFAVMSEDLQQQFQEKLEVDFSFEVPEVARFRANVYRQSRGISAAFRTIPPVVASLEELNFPAIFTDIAKKPRGLVLVTGPTGSGKSTTLAAMLDYINRHFYHHIITVEDPIEFVHQSKSCVINQRELAQDTHSFQAALRSALRQDPDIILVGELRDLETIRLALTAAETGHLVFATLHTTSAAKTINRIIDVFPGEEKAMVRSMLSTSLEAVIAQTLLKKKDSGRVAALEIMLCNNAIRNLIREDKVAQIYSSIQTGQEQGMMTLDQHLKQLILAGLISKETAAEVAVNKTDFV